MLLLMPAMIKAGNIPPIGTHFMITEKTGKRMVTEKTGKNMITE